MENFWNFSSSAYDLESYRELMRRQQEAASAGNPPAAGAPAQREEQRLPPPPRRDNAFNVRALREALPGGSQSVHYSSTRVDRVHTPPPDYGSMLPSVFAVAVGFWGNGASRATAAQRAGIRPDDLRRYVGSDGLTALGRQYADSLPPAYRRQVMEAVARRPRGGMLRGLGRMIGVGGSSSRAAPPPGASSSRAAPPPAPRSQSGGYDASVARERSSRREGHALAGNRPVGMPNQYGVGRTSPTLEQAVQAWYDTPDANRQAAWENIHQETQGAFITDEPFWTLLDSLKGSAEHPAEAGDTAETRMMRAQMRAAFKERVTCLLDAVRENQELRRQCFEIADDATRTCHDNVTLGFSRMELKHLAMRAIQGEFAQQDLALLGIGFFKLAVLEELAVVKARESGNADESMEVALAYQTKLAAELDLPAKTKAMRYYRTAGITDDDLRAARSAVIQAATDSARIVDFLAGWEPWQKDLERRHPEQFDRAALETEKNELKEKMEALQETYDKYVEEEGEDSPGALNTGTEMGALMNKLADLEQNRFGDARRRLTEESVAVQTSIRANVEHWGQAIRRIGSEGGGHAVGAFQTLIGANVALGQRLWPQAPRPPQPAIPQGRWPEGPSESLSFFHFPSTSSGGWVPASPAVSSQPVGGVDDAALAWTVSNIEAHSFRNAIHALAQYRQYVTDVDTAAQFAQMPGNHLGRLLQSGERNDGTSWFQLTPLGEAYVEAQFSYAEGDSLRQILGSR